MAKTRVSNKGKFCQVQGCESPRYSKGYCTKHYRQFQRHGKTFERTKYDKNEFVINGDVCLIQMYNAKLEKTDVAIVDAKDFELVKNYKWFLANGGYAVTRVSGEALFLSRLLMAPVPEGYEIDHKDRTRLNNRRSNLRYATHAQNCVNSFRCTNTSGFKGVSWSKSKSKWMPEITYQGRQYHLGRFDSKKDAARAYNKKAIEFFGEFAFLNNVN